MTFLNKNPTKKENKAFTLIELLVVISIIALLSSVVLASLKNARERAKSTAFKAEINQLVTALELYKNVNGKYPHEDDVDVGYNISKDGLGTYNSNYTETSNPNELEFFSDSVMGKYIKSFPTPTIATNKIFYYIYPAITDARCVGDDIRPSYFLTINQNEPGFEDWPFLMVDGAEITAYKCFSLK